MALSGFFIIGQVRCRRVERQTFVTAHLVSGVWWAVRQGYGRSARRSHGVKGVTAQVKATTAQVEELAPYAAEQQAMRAVGSCWSATCRGSAMRAGSSPGVYGRAVLACAWPLPCGPTISAAGTGIGSGMCVAHTGCASSRTWPLAAILGVCLPGEPAGPDGVRTSMSESVASPIRTFLTSRQAAVGRRGAPAAQNARVVRARFVTPATDVRLECIAEEWCGSVDGILLA